MYAKGTWRVLNVAAAAIGMVLMIGATTLVQAQGLDPASVTATIRPGDGFDVTKTVITPVIPPRPDICFLADTTASMGATLTNVRNNATMIMNLVRAVQPDSQFCAAQYKDAGDSPEFQVDQFVTANTAAVQTAINTWGPAGGGDTPEGQLHALTTLVGAAGYRPDSTRIIVWFGDASGHDPSIGGETLASTIAALNGGNVKVIAVPVTGSGDGLDSTLQATAITGATSGVLLAGASPAQVTNAIVTGLTNLPVTVSMASDCAAVTGGAVTTTFAPASQVVTSGNSAVFTETIHVSLTAVQGQTYNCADHALLDGTPMNDATGNLVLETKTITVADITAPSAQCAPGPNPGGNIPKAGDNPKSGQNPDGFYTLNASDNVAVTSVVVCDSGSSFCSNPFAPGDNVKITQSQSAPRDERPGPGGLVSHLFFNGDGVLKVTDSSGNVTTASCLVPRPPK